MIPQGFGMDLWNIQFSMYDCKIFAIQTKPMLNHLGVFVIIYLLKNIEGGT